VEALRQLGGWPARTAAAGVLGGAGELGVAGPRGALFRWASVTKVLTTLAILVAVEEGIVELDEPAGPPGATLRHLLAHAAGLGLDDPEPVTVPGRRRIYSNAGIEAAAALLEPAAAMSFADYVRAAVHEPLGLRGGLRGSPASSYEGPLDDLLALAGELLAPTLLAPETVAEATRVQFPGLAGVLPGFGRQVPNDWGLGVELRDAKSPHWTGTRNSPRTFGHFGATGTFLWVDPEAGIACACLTDLEFGDWAKDGWPRLSDAVLSEAGV
jgi:CubicO group peptidase (beta-lactamase class C family)